MLAKKRLCKFLSCIYIYYYGSSILTLFRTTHVNTVQY